MEHEALSHIMRIRRARQEDLPALQAAAAEDNHGIYTPTHVCTRAGEVVGYMSMGAIPVLLTWQHTQRVKVRDSIHMLAFAEDSLRDQGASQLIIPVDAKSPYLSYLPKAGYVEAEGVTKVFIKNLTIN
jgi:hypothetical protein